MLSGWLPSPDAAPSSLSGDSTFLLAATSAIASDRNGGVSAASAAATSEVSGPFTYSVIDGSVTITAFDSKVQGHVEIPAAINGLPVTKIGAEAFSNSTGVTGFTLPASVTSLGESAFFRCSRLQSIAIPASVTSLGNFAFYDCSQLQSIVIPASVTSIGVAPFGGCSSLSSIGVDAANRSYTSFDGLLCDKAITTLIQCPGGRRGTVTLPATVTTDPSPAFGGCPYLTAIQVASGNTSYRSVDGVLYGKLKNPASTWLVRCPEGKAGSLTIPEGVTSVGQEAFARCKSLTGVALPVSVTRIFPFAFAGCGSLRGVTMPGVKQIEDYAFSHCGRLRSVTIPATSIGEAAFWNCTSLENVTLMPGVTTIGTCAFFQCTSLRAVPIPASVTSIGESAFESCTNLRSIAIPGSATTIGFAAFADCRSLQAVSIGAGVQSIGDQAFADCRSLRAVTIASGVTSIGDRAFEGCRTLPAIVIPASVTNMAAEAFRGCWSLTTVGVDPGNPAFRSIDGILYDGSATTLILCPFGKTGSLTIPEGVTGIGSWAFAERVGLQALSIPNSVKTIGERAFYGCESLTGLRIPTSVTAIGDAAFQLCTRLESIILPAGLTSIGSAWFLDCTSLRSVAIPAGVTSIGVQAFAGCESLQSVVIPAGVTAVENSVFNGCANLQTVFIPSSVTSIGTNAFGNCSSLQAVTLPAGVTSIGGDAFRDCTSLQAVTLPAGVVSIGGDAFVGCTSLQAITIPASVTAIESNSFARCSRLTSIVVDPANARYVSSDGLLYDRTTTTLVQCPAGKGGRVTIMPGTTSIEQHAFDGCASLQAIAIPAGVTTIGSLAFSGCTNLQAITIPASVTSIGSLWLFNGPANLTGITVDSANLNYRSVDGVLYDKAGTTLVQCPGGTRGDFTIPNGVTSIAAYAFQGCANLRSVAIPAGVTTIEEGAFDGCASLQAIDLPSGVTSHLNNAFGGCTSLRSVTIPATVTTIGRYAFDGCTSLQAIVIPASVTSIEDSAFRDCTSLKGVTIPASVASIELDVFQGCTNLTEILVDSANAAYRSTEGVLYDKQGSTLIRCPQGKIGFVSIPTGVVVIGDSAFNDCTGLTEVAIPASVIEVEDYAFSGCTNLANVHFFGAAPYVNATTFGNAPVTLRHLADAVGWSTPYQGYASAVFRPYTVTAGDTLVGMARVSTDAIGNLGNGSSLNPVFSPDGTKIAFASDASNLVTGDTNGRRDIFVKDLTSGAVARISTAADGTPGNDTSSTPVFSPDGLNVAFSSYASNLVPGDTNGVADIFIKNLVTGVITRVSTRADGGQANDGSSNPVFSPDGTQVAFESSASNLDGGPGFTSEVFVKDLANGWVFCVSTNAAGTSGDRSSYNPVFSTDGTKIVFVSDASNLVAGDTNGCSDIFVKNIWSGEITRVSTDMAGAQGNGHSFAAPAFSPDGTRVAFVSKASNLVSGDTNATDDVFVKNLVSGAIARVSTDVGGAQADKFSTSPVFSPDGMKVAFASAASNLVPGDGNGVFDIFIKDLAGGSIIQVSQNATRGQGLFGSLQPAFSRDRTRVAFVSDASNLVPGASTQSFNVYVATLDLVLTVPENTTAVGGLLAYGVGGTDAARFTTGSDGVLSFTAAPNFEDAGDRNRDNTYDVELSVGNGTYTAKKHALIRVTDVNDTPTDLALSSTIVRENQPSGTVAASLSAIDPDVGDAVTYSLVGGSGSTDNDSFTIQGTELRTATTFNVDARSNYSIRIRCTDRGGLSAEKAFTITVLGAPRAPTGLTAVIGNGEVQLSWLAPASNGGSPITDYVVQYKIAGQPTADWTTFADGVSTARGALVTKLGNGTAYLFRVAAANAIGPGTPSADSAPAKPQPVPSAPAGVTVTTVGDHKVVLKWSVPSSNGGKPITDYIVQFKSLNDPMATWTTFADGTSTSRTTKVTRLTNGTSYVFRVAAVNKFGQGFFSASSVPAIPATVPDAPTGLTVTPASTSIRLSWTAPTNNGGATITGYVVRYKPVNALKWTTMTVTSTSYTMIGLSSTRAYVFRVAARNGIGTGAFTATSVAVKPLA